jgi:hypothetical protein
MQQYTYLQKKYVLGLWSKGEPWDSIQQKYNAKHMPQRSIGSLRKAIRKLKNDPQFTSRLYLKEHFTLEKPPGATRSSPSV